MTKMMNCVIRNVAGLDQYVPVSEVPSLNAGETLFSGEFRLETEKDGPSKSHTRTICLPTGKLNRNTVMSCVIREVNGIDEFVPVSEVPFVNPGEKVFTSVWSTYQVNAGPYGSHRRTLCTRTSVPVTETVEQRKAA